MPRLQKTVTSALSTDLSPLPHTGFHEAPAMLGGPRTRQGRKERSRGPGPTAVGKVRNEHVQVPP